MNRGLFRSRPAMRLLAIALIICTWLPGSAAWGAVVVPPPDMDPLNQIAVTQPSTLSLFVKNNTAAIRLGKAFFWDMQVGSDGIVACATCHFKAGADPRLKNQINPGLKAGDTTFGFSVGTTPAGWGPNYTLTPADFPLHQRQDPADLQSSPILRDTNDVVGSQGVRLSQFVGIEAGSSVDITTPISDPVFNVGGVNTRRVEPRNTPTVINTIFNFLNFWDGRAHFLFNGENPFGPADPNAGVWFNDPVQGLVKRPVEIQFASLASLAVAPPVDEFEMSARGRTFPQIGRKMLTLTPLGKQLVHPRDSVLDSLSRAVIQPGGKISGLKGLNTTYSQMIRDAFQNNLWNSSLITPDGFTQMEANFSLFWGLAIQLYLATLVSDQTPFDRWVGGDTTALTEQQKFGFALFSGIGNCAVCHGGTELSNNSHTVAAFNTNLDNAIIDVMFVADGNLAIYDDGFNNTAVRPTTEDIARGGTAPFINPLTGQPYPLAFTSLSILQRQNRVPFEVPFLDPFFPIDIFDNKDGLFKVPGLRNVELTAPYFHNGSVMNLEEVIDFYARGGNFPAANFHDLDPIIGEGNSLLQGREDFHAALVAFLKSLTDERVRSESAPFDHPELFVPEGDPEVLTRIPATDVDGSKATSVLTINPVTSPTNQTSQAISGTVEAGSTPAVTVDTPATVGPATVIGTDWSVEISGITEGANVITVSVVDSFGVLTTLQETILLDTVAPALTLNPVTTPTSLDSQTISGTVETGIRPVVTVSLPVIASPIVITGGTVWGSVILNLQQGANDITITATDRAGNTTTLQTDITVGAPVLSHVFDDVLSDHWAYSHVEAVFEAGITGGCTTSPPLFCPDDPVTRGQMAVFIETALGHSQSACPGQFADVSASDPFCGFIERLAEDGITGGCGNGNFCPGDPVTRGQMAVFIESALGNSANACTEQFADVTAANPFCGFIERLAGDGITSGCGNGNFCPDKPVTRAEMAVFLVAAPDPLMP